MAEEKNNSKPRRVQGQDIDYGKSLLNWSFPEYIQYSRSKSWYIIIGILLVIVVFYALLTGNLLFALFLILFGLVLVLQTRRSPSNVEFKISEKGIAIGERFYDWSDINNFRFVYKPPEVKRLYIDLKNVLLPDFSVPLKDQEPGKIRKILKNYLEEDVEKTEETIIDRLGRWLKI